MTAPNQDAPSIESLISDLSSTEAIVRQRARHRLVSIGASAVSKVAALAESEDVHVRWECAKTLADIADPSSIATLIQLLEDKDRGITWDAALGLIAIGQPAAKPVLQAVIDRTQHFSIVSGAHHVLHAMCKTSWGASLRPVYEALDSPEPSVTAPAEALKALEALEAMGA